MSTLYMMVGCPGSGKSTFAKTLKGKYISRDEIRFKLLQDEDDYFAKEGEVFQKFIYEIEEGLSKYGDVIVDATHLNKGSRHKLSKSGQITISSAPSLERNSFKVKCSVSLIFPLFE